MDVTENEILKQNNYLLQTQLESKAQIADSLHVDLEFQRKAYDECVSKKKILEKENDVLTQQVSNLGKRNSELEQVHEDVVCENVNLKKKITALEKQLQDLTLTEESSVNTSFSQWNSLKEDLVARELKNNELQSTLNNVLIELKKFQTSEENLTNKVKELEEGIKDRDRDIFSYSTKIQEAKDLEVELQHEMDMLKFQQVDVGRQGNSVYGELDDRRKMAETQFKNLKKQYNSLLVKYDVKVKELIKYRDQVAALKRATSRDFHNKYVDELQQELEETHFEVEKVCVLLKSAQSDLQELKTQQSRRESNDESFLEVLLQQAGKEVSIWKNNWMNLQTEKMAQNDTLKHIRLQLLKTQDELDSCQLETENLKMELFDLKSTSELEKTIVETNLLQ